MSVVRDSLGTTVFILCAGSAERWNDYLGVPKQLIEFGGERLLARTVRLVEAAAAVRRVYCVTRDPRIFLERHRTMRIRPNGSLAETILATSPRWSARNVLLLGDVFYSERGLSRIVENQRNLAFFGRPWPSAYVKCRHGELFGASFSQGAADVMRRAASAVVAAMGSGIAGNLWNVYQTAAGLQFGSSRLVLPLLVPIDDFTNDVDTPADYERRRAIYERIASGADSRVSSLLNKLVLSPRHMLGLVRWSLSVGRRHGMKERSAPVAKGSHTTHD